MLKRYFADRDFKALLFDFDGTVADTMPAHLNAWNKALAVYGLTLSREQHLAWAGRPTKMIVQMLNEIHGTSIAADEFVARKEKDYFEVLGDVRAITPIVDIIKFYSGKIPMAIVSGSRHVPVERTLAHLQLARYFDELICAEDYTHGKPAPDCFLIAAERLHVPAHDCLVFEDGELGIQSAHAAGMSCLRISPEFAISVAKP